MRTIVFQLLTISLLFLFTEKISAQVRNIILLDSATKEPIANAGLMWEEYDGTVSNEKGLATIQKTESNTVRISHVNYQPKTITIKSLPTKAISTIILSPLTPGELSEVIIASSPDKWLVGKWICTGIGFVNNKGKRVSNGYATNNIKEYLKDKSFVISHNGNTLLTGTFATINNQIRESISTSNDRSLEGIINILFYTVSKDKNTLTVKYKLPNSNYITEETWLKLK